MNAPNGARALLLEQLESRCLLAAGLVRHTDMPEMLRHDQHDSTGVDSRPALFSTAHAASKQQPRTKLDGAAANWRRTATSATRHELVSVLTPQTNSLRYVPVQEASAQSSAVPQTVSRLLGDPSANEKALPSATVQLLTIVRLPFADSGNNARVSNATGGDGDTRSTQVREMTIDNVASQLSKANNSVIASQSLVVPMTGFESTEVTGPTNGYLDSTQLHTLAGGVADVGALVNKSKEIGAAVQISSIGVSNAEHVRGARSGMIEFSPRGLHELNQPAEYRAEHLWKIEADVLRRLRIVANDAKRDVGGSRQDTVDQAIAQWFGKSTGFIDDINCLHALPVHRHELPAMKVEVALDATIGLNRSFSVIAHQPIESQTSSIRDAILAAIADESSASENAIAEPTSVRFSGLSQPGAFLFATLAIAGRRRRYMKLESSRGSIDTKKPDSLYLGFLTTRNKGIRHGR